jgi:hypothetical protein
MRALRWSRAEYAAGRRHAPLVCDACGQDEGPIEAHSEDYSEPFGSHIGEPALCFRCHVAVHCQFKNPVAWEAYKLQVRQRRVFAARSLQPPAARQSVAARPQMPLHTVDLDKLTRNTARQLEIIAGVVDFIAAAGERQKLAAQRAQVGILDVPNAKPNLPTETAFATALYSRSRERCLEC